MIIVDYKSTTLRTNPSISVARKVLTILQHHYVETLGRAIVVNLPMILSFFYRGIAPFLDPVTRDKMRFNPDLFELVPREQLDADFGGEYEYEFEPESYWDQLIEYVITLVWSLFLSPLSFTHMDGGAHTVLFINRACGIAPDGTRITETLPAPRMPTRPTCIPSAKDHSPRFAHQLFITALIINLMICS